MATDLTVTPNERSSIAITASFTDEDGAAVVPSSLTYSLLHRDRTVVNSKKNVAVTPASTVTILLQGADLALDSSDTGERVLTIYATYTSTLGTGITLTDEAYFTVANLYGVPALT